MTTHIPYGPDTAAAQQSPHHPPATAYPTAPPWANPQPAVPDEPPPANGPVTPWGAPYTEHGKLLVPFPEEMHNAARPRPPSWWPVVAWTFFFGILALISVTRRADQARRGRNSVAPYWVAWAVTMALGTVAGMAVAVAGVPAYLAYRESAATEVVQEKVAGDGQVLKATGAAATSATCAATGPRVGGVRPYDCRLALADGRTGSLSITADDDGNWTTAVK
jgi:hypothetical protein